MLRRLSFSPSRTGRLAISSALLDSLARASLLLLIAALAGCSSKKVEGRKEVFPVRGKLLVDNQPAPGAMLVLHPLNATAEAERPFGKVGADGSFELTTYEGKDGAPAGDYIVTAQWQVSADKDAPGPWPNALPPIYSDPKQSDLKVTIAPGTNELQPFSLSRIRR
jgi:hypothetical protein